MKGWRPAAALLVMAATCLGIGRWLWGEAPSGRPLKVAVVDLARVWQGYQKKVYFDEEIDRLGKLKQAPLLEKKAEVDQLRQKIELLAAGSAQRDAAESELAQKNIELEALDRASRQELGLKLLEYMDIIYTDILSGVNQVGEREAFDLVLKTSETKRRAKSIREFQARLEGQVVLYSAPHLDLTDTVLATLNERFAESSQGKE